MLGGKLVGVLVLSLVWAVGAPIDVTVAGRALETTIGTSMQADFFVPDTVAITSSSLEVSPLYEIGGVPYRYQRVITIGEPAGVARTDENLELSLSLPGMRDDCKDVVLAGPALIPYQRISCAPGAIVLRAIVPSIAGSGTLYWRVYYGNPDDAIEKSQPVLGRYTTTHPDQAIGACTSQADHCSTSRIGTSTCSGPPSYTLPYPVRVTGSRCSSSRACGTGCSPVCAMTGWDSDTGTTVSGTASGSTTCATAIQGGFNHNFYLDWSRLLSASAGPAEYANATITLSYDGTPLLDGELSRPANLTLPLSPGNHTVSFNATAPIRIIPFLHFSQNQTINASPTFTTDQAHYSFTIASDLPVFTAAFTTPEVFNPNSTRAFSYSHGAWSIHEGGGNATISFTAPRHNLVLSRLSSPVFELRPSGVPASYTGRACFGTTCYLEHGTALREATLESVFNPDDRIIATVMTDHPAECRAGSSSNQTENNTCTLELHPGGVRIQTFNSTDWSAGQLEANLTTRSLALRIDLAGSGVPGQPLLFSGRATDPATGEGINGTALVVLVSASRTHPVLFNVTEGGFHGTLTIPEPGTWSVRAVVLEEHPSRSLWATWSGTLQSSTPAPPASSSTPSPAGSGSGSGGGGLSSTAPTTQPDPAQSHPEALEFFTSLYRAVRLGQSSLVVGIQQEGERLMLEENYTGLEPLSSRLSWYAQQGEAKEWEAFEKFNQSLFIYPEESIQLHALLLSVLEEDADPTALHAFESSLQDAFHLREQELREKLLERLQEVPDNSAGLVAQCVQIVMERGTPEGRGALSARRYSRALDCLEPVPALENATPAPVRPPSPQPEVPLSAFLLLSALPLLCIPASAARHVRHWK